MNRPRAVVLSSFTVHPDMPSEPGVGWQFLLATARNARAQGCRAILITMERSAEAIVEALKCQDLSDVVLVVPVVYPVRSKYFRWHDPKYTRIEHMLWMLSSRKYIRQIADEWDVIYAHHATFATELLPPPIVHFDASVLRVWGPVGAGGVAAVFRIPPAGVAMWKQTILQLLRDSIAAIPARWTARRVDVILAQNSAIQKLLPKQIEKIRIFPNVIVPNYDNFPANGAISRETKTLRILQVGHFIPRKRNDLAVYSLLQDILVDAELHIVGAPINGDKNRISELATELGLKDRLVFHGVLNRSEVLQLMEQMDVLLHTSGREGASGVVGEATAVGLPVVCFADTGAASVLTQSGGSGLVLEAGSGLTVKDIAKAVTEAARLPRIKSDVWTTGRIDSLVSELYDEATKNTGRSNV